MTTPAQTVDQTLNELLALRCTLALQFCHKYTLERLKKLPQVAGCEAKLRMDGDKPYVTDNHNFIVDLYFQTPIKDSHAASKAILDLEGVVDHGLFLDMVDVCIIAGQTGVEVKERPKKH